MSGKKGFGAVGERAAGPAGADGDFQWLVAEEARGGAASAFPAWRVASGVAVLGVLAAAIVAAAGNEAFDWPTVGEYLFSPKVLYGLWTTIWLTAVVTALSVVLGTLVATMRLSRNPVLSATAWGYVWLFRATPLLVQLLFWFNIGYLVPEVTIGLPGLAPFVSIPTNNLISALGAAILGLTMHGTAHAAEFVRGGLLAVPHGQIEAAGMLGLSPAQIFLKIVFPQSMRTIIPALGNFLIDVLKGTSIISVVAVAELLYSVQLIYNRNYLVIPLLLVATFWYIAVTSVLSVGQHYIERYFGRGYARKSARAAAGAAPEVRPVPAGVSDVA